MEDLYPTTEWGKSFRAFVMSAPVDSDLLQAQSWTNSKRLARDSAWLGGRFGGWLEGNAVVAPDGSIVDLLRADYRAGDREYAAIVRIGSDGRQAAFSPEDFVEFPGGCKKFTVRHDAQTNRYWALSNVVAGGFENSSVERTRNTLALTSSEDLRAWQVDRIVLQHPDVAKHAFQYADWLFDGDDLIAVCRTAFDDAAGGAHNQHDANYMTFHRIECFRC
jgi:hypothetical protein